MFIDKNKRLAWPQHRLTTIKNCDNIVVIKEGKLVEQGTHDDLLKIEIKQKKEDGKDDTYQGICETTAQTPFSNRFSPLVAVMVHKQDNVVSLKMAVCLQTTTCGTRR